MLRGRPATTTPYDDTLRDRIRAVLGDASPDPAIARGLTDAHAACIEALLSQHPEYKNKI